jgi:hypothetical protein
MADNKPISLPVMKVEEKETRKYRHIPLTIIPRGQDGRNELESVTQKQVVCLYIWRPCDLAE